MGVVGDVVGEAVDTVADVASDVWSGVTDVVDDAVDVVNMAISPLALVISETFDEINGWQALAITSTIAATAGAVMVAGPAISSFAASVNATVSSVSASMSAFAEAIHLETIIATHEIAYIMSEDYRGMVDQVMGRIAEVSGTIFDNIYFVPLALQNARSIVLDVQTTLGRAYDQAELAWLRTMNNFLGEWEGRLHSIADPVDTYRNNPHMLFQDINEHIIRPQVDAKGESQQGVLSTINNGVQVLNTTVQDLNTLRSDLTQFVADLPAQIRDDIMPEINAVNGRIDGFLQENYYPWRDRTNRVLGVLESRQEDHTGRMDDIVGRLTRPGDILQQIDRLPSDDRMDQARKISDAANTVSDRESDALQEEALDLRRELERIAEALTVPTEAPEILRREPGTPSPPAGRLERGPDTWFVGDY